jgi:hypothetical protein
VAIPPPIPVQPGSAVPPRIPTQPIQPPPPLHPPVTQQPTPPRIPPTPAQPINQPPATQNPTVAQAQRFAKDAGNAVVSATKTAGAAVQTFFQKNPPAKLLDKMGPVGSKIKTHKGPAIAIGAGLLLVCVVLIVRGCNSGSTTTTGGGGTITTDNTNTKPNDTPFNPKTQQPAQPPRDIADAQFRAGAALMVQSYGPTDARFQRGLAQVTDAANQGNTSAMLYLAQLYGTPQYNTYNLPLAVKWARKAQTAGDPNAAQVLYALGQQP